MKLLKEYIRQIISEGTLRTHSLAALALNDRRGRKAIIYDVVNESLKESAHGGASGLGAATRNSFDQSTAILYDTGTLVQLLSNEDVQADKKPLEDRPHLRAAVLDSVIKGYIRIHNASGECHNTAFVVSVAGPGYGKELYSMGHAMSRSGLLAPSRTSVSSEAAKAWKSAVDKGKKGHKLDPRDCPVHTERGKEYLDYAYEPSGSEQQLMSQLKSRHDTALKELSHIPNTEQRVWGLLHSVGYLDFLDKFELS